MKREDKLDYLKLRSELLREAKKNNTEIPKITDEMLEEFKKRKGK